MTLAQSVAARQAFRASAARDRTERRLFENLAEIRIIEESAKSATSRRRAERTRQARRDVRDEPHPASTLSKMESAGGPARATPKRPAWGGHGRDAVR